MLRNKFVMRQYTIQYKSLNNNDIVNKPMFAVS